MKGERERVESERGTRCREKKADHRSSISAGRPFLEHKFALCWRWVDFQEMWSEIHNSSGSHVDLSIQGPSFGSKTQNHVWDPDSKSSESELAHHYSRRREMELCKYKTFPKVDDKNIAARKVTGKSQRTLERIASRNVAGFHETHNQWHLVIAVRIVSTKPQIECDGRETEAMCGHQ